MQGESGESKGEIIIDHITIDESTEELTNDTPQNTSVANKSESGMKEPDIKTEPLPLSKITTPVTEKSRKDQSIEQKVEPVAVYEEETRMSADNNNSRAQTPARQFVVPPPSEGPEESQSSVQSSATTESGKNKKGRLEVCDYDRYVLK